MYLYSEPLTVLRWPGLSGSKLRFKTQDRNSGIWFCGGLSLQMLQKHNFQVGNSRGHLLKHRFGSVLRLLSLCLVACVVRMGQKPSV